MSELLFECYGVPSVAYGIDALFSAHQNIGIEEGTDALIVSSGHQTTYILPVLNGQLDATHCKRYAATPPSISLLSSFVLPHLFHSLPPAPFPYPNYSLPLGSFPMLVSCCAVGENPEPP